MFALIIKNIIPVKGYVVLPPKNPLSQSGRPKTILQNNRVKKVTCHVNL